MKIDTGVVIADMMRISGGGGLGLPPELLLLGKMLLNLDQVVTQAADGLLDDLL